MQTPSDSPADLAADTAAARKTPAKKAAATTTATKAVAKTSAATTLAKKSPAKEHRGGKNPTQRDDSSVPGSASRRRTLPLFLSYRRDDAPAVVGRIRDRLADHFGRDNVFLDVDNIPIGADLVTHIATLLRRSGAAIVIIGPKWATIRSEDDRRRLDIDDDYVRMEIEEAFRRNIPVIPVLVEGARMPTLKQLPSSISKLSRRNALSVRHDPDFHSDIDRLIGRLAPPTGVGKTPQDRRMVANVGLSSLSAKDLEDRARKRDAAGDADGAIEDYNQLIRLQPKNARAFEKRGMLRAESDLDAAIADFTDAYRLGGGYRPLSLRASSWDKKGDLKLAELDYDEAIELCRESGLFAARASVRERRGNLSGAIDDYTEAMRVGNHKYFLEERTQLRRRLGDWRWPFDWLSAAVRG